MVLRAFGKPTFMLAEPPVAWVRAKLREQRVYVRATDDGQLDVRGGRVEVRYRPHDGRKYDASPRNLSSVEGDLLPDDTCGPVQAAGAAAAPTSKKSRATSGNGDSAPLEATDGAVIAYTDGACTGNPGPAGLGVVLLASDGRRECAEFLGQATNNIAELTAILRALEATHDDRRPLAVWTDSQYSIGVLSKGWRAKANTELVEEIRSKLVGRKVSFHYVRGHSGSQWNERCDELARLAIATRASSPLVRVV